MEVSTAGVVGGAKRAEEAGDSLRDIEDVSTRLAALIQGISDSAKKQSAVANDVSTTMNIIQEITLQTSEGTEETSTALNALSELATELQRSVSGFKLPQEEQDSVENVMLDGDRAA
jgi:twitching motility protein PilJ